MSSPFLGEIRLFGGNFAPQNWAMCNGALLPIDGYDALYNLIGTTYGGNGVTTFGLPDLTSRVPVHQGSSYVIGAKGGVEQVTLNDATMPVHNHPLYTAAGNQVASPNNALLSAVASGQDGCLVYGTATANVTSLMGQTIQTAGNSQPHDNIQPYLGLTFIIALFGIYPSQG